MPERYSKTKAFIGVGGRVTGKDDGMPLRDLTGPDCCMLHWSCVLMLGTNKLLALFAVG